MDDHQEHPDVGEEVVYNDPVDLERGVTEDDSSVGKEEEEDVEVSDWFVRLLEGIKYILSFVLTIFSIVMVSAAIFSKQTTATGDKSVHPLIAFVVFWVLILWLALMEGGLNCMVGLLPIDKDLYDTTHPLAFKCTSLAHRGDNIGRFIVGRQYLDIMVVFITSFMVSTIDDASVFGLPEPVNHLFLSSGLAVILVTIVFGQLVSQINSANAMLDFVNNYAMVFTTYAALTVEASGILHAVYLVQMLFAKLSGKKIESNEPPKTRTQTIFFWGRVALSVSILLAALVVTIFALIEGQTTMWSRVPVAASFVLLVGLVLIVGLMEGLQIALFTVVHMPEDVLQEHPTAQRNCQRVFCGQTLEAFLVGRQICQTIIMFMIARISTVDMNEESDNLFGVSDTLQSFFNTGILGALIFTILASLSWRIVATSFPLAFLSNPAAAWIIRLCLAVEWTGVCYSAWFFAYIHQSLVRYQPDEYHIGTAEDRASPIKTSLDLTEVPERASDTSFSSASA